MKIIKLLLLLIIFVAITYCVYHLVLQTASQLTISNLLLILTTISATLAGFSVTALSILFAISDRKLMRNMQKTGHAHHILHLLFVVSGLFLLTLLLSMSGYLLDNNAADIITSASIALFVVSIVIFASAGRKFYSILVILDEVERESEHPLE